MTGRDTAVAIPKSDKSDLAMPPVSTADADGLVVHPTENKTRGKATNHLRSYFLANITHEFRTPLSVLNASIEYLLDEYYQLSRDEIHELLKSIHLGAIGLQTLIDNLLESTNIEAGRFAIRPEPIKFGDAVAAAIRIMRPFVDRRHQCVLVDDGSGSSLVFADLPRLTQVLVNLLSNASKFGPMGQTIDLHIEVTDDGKVRASVADRGPGIPPEYRANLFQRFLRLNSPDGAQYGIGLGLSVVKITVEEHGGEVGVEERPGGGSVFWFTVPLADDAL